MGNNWIIPVLADLRTFARENDLPLLADQLEQSAVVAKAEIGPLKKDASAMVCREAAETRPLLASIGAGRRA